MLRNNYKSVSATVLSSLGAAARVVAVGVFSVVGVVGVVVVVVVVAFGVLSSDPLSPGLLGETRATGGARPPSKCLSQAEDTLLPLLLLLRLLLLPAPRLLILMGMGVFLEEEEEEEVGCADFGVEGLEEAKAGRLAETARGVNICGRTSAGSYNITDGDGCCCCCCCCCCMVGFRGRSSWRLPRLPPRCCCCCSNPSNPGGTTPSRLPTTSISASRAASISASRTASSKSDDDGEEGEAEELGERGGEEGETGGSVARAFRLIRSFKDSGNR